MNQLPPFEKYNAHGVNDRAVTRINKFLHWLGSRNVPVRTLLLLRAGVDVQRLENLTLPVIDTLHWEVSDDSEVHVNAVLRCLPNLTDIHEAAIFDASLTPKLKVLTYSRCNIFRMLPFEGTCLSLQELRLRGGGLSDSLTERLREGCPNLQLLEILLRGGDFNCLLNLLQTNLFLQELVIRGVVVGKALEIVALFPNIRRLTVTEVILSHTDTAEIFISVHEHSPHLEYIRTSDLSYSRQDGGTLNIATATHDPNSIIAAHQVSRLFGTFKPLTKLAWHLSLDPDVAVMIAATYSATLKSLTAPRIAAEELNMLLQRCGGIRDLQCGHLSNDSLEIIAGACPQLVSLSLCLDGAEEVVGFSALCAACTKLKELTIEMHLPKVLTLSSANYNLTATLAIIVIQNVRLRLLKLVGDFCDTDVAFFRQLAREKQLLPMPVITLQCK